MEGELDTALDRNGVTSCSPETGRFVPKFPLIFLFRIALETPDIEE